MATKAIVALRAILTGGVAAFAKIASVMKAADGVKMGVTATIMTPATTAITAAATAAVAGSKQEQKMLLNSLQNIWNHEVLDEAIRSAE
ncbi:uncharacterized protein DS421_1g15480 [Arachis hypogaea]|nr:uncharacterized protein DS421_1g15480 [Arachis hypogaea]